METRSSCGPSPQGKVVGAGDGDKAGGWVKIDHGNGVETVYVHISGLSVRTGQSVAGGQRIAVIDGPSGNAVEAQLHFEIKLDGQSVDPVPFIFEAASDDLKTEIAAANQRLEVLGTGTRHPGSAGVRSVRPRAGGGIVDEETADESKFRPRPMRPDPDSRTVSERLHADRRFAMTVEPKKRLKSLDVMRGATIAGMLLVNNAGDWGHTFAPLLHAEWNGWTPTDLVFPFFLFMVGVAIPLAFATRLEKSGGDLGPLYRQIVRRTIILFALGLFLTWFPFMGINWSTVRIPGVLQRIALVYFFASLAYLHLGTRGRAWLTGGLLLGYWLAMTRVPVPGFGAGDLSPEGNLAGFVDRVVLGAHVWRYAPGPADPEGILSTLPAIATALAGIFTGEWLRTQKSQNEKLIGLFVAGSLAAAAGAVFGWFFPVNKNLWTSSYVVLTAGLALLTLAVTLYFVDLEGGTGGRSRSWSSAPIPSWPMS